MARLSNLKIYLAQETLMPSNYTKERNELKILLMQIRQDQKVAAEELSSFAKHAELAESQITVLNVFEKMDFDSTMLSGFDSLWVGGASEANVLQPEKYAFIEKAKQLLLHCCENNIPVFASCFGFQLAVLALGGKITDSSDDFEMGTLPITLAFNSRSDVLMKDTPNNFYAVSVHKQKALKVPPKTALLAYSEVCVHAFKVIDKPFWAFQFHPEVDQDILEQRLTIYRDRYTQNPEALDEVLSNTQQTPEANKLMKKFVDRVLLNQIT